MTYTFGATTLDDGTHYFLLDKSFDLVGNVPALLKIGRIEGMTKSGTMQSERVLPLTVRVVGASRLDLESKLDTLYQGLALPQQQLAIHATDTRYFIADCLAVSTELTSPKGPSFPGSSAIMADVVVTFVCVNPYAFAATASTYDTGTLVLTNASGVFSSPTIAFVGGGTAPAAPQIRLTTVSISGGAPVITQIVLTQTTDNKTLTIGGTPQPSAANDYVDIYCDPTNSNGFSVIKNSQTALSPISTGVYPLQEPGTTFWTLAYTTTGTTALSVDAKFTWTAQWLA